MLNIRRLRAYQGKICFSERQSRMFKTIFLLVVVLFSFSLSAQEIATCRSPSGRAFYHFDGVIKKADSGWIDDKISSGVFSFTRANDGAIDILYVDTRFKPISASQDGGIVRLLRASAANATVLVFYPDGATTEIYTFFKEKDGGHKFTLLQSKSGEQVIAPKSALMVGNCEPIRFDLLK
jgi:hypothetical protein